MEIINLNMPRKKINQINMNKSLDNKNTAVENVENGLVELSLSPLKDISLSDAQSVNTEPQYTESPDGKYKFLIKSEQNDDYLEDRTQNIPTVRIPGHVVYWPHDVKPYTLPRLLAKGWNFVPKHVLQEQNADRRVVAGRNQAGETCCHYAMYMSESKKKELDARESAERFGRLQSMKIAPSIDSQGIYGTEQMDFSRGVMTPKAK